MLKYIGQGRMRVVFRVGKFVVKFPKNLAGVRACAEELFLWLKHRSKYMAPVKFASPGVCIVMPYYPEPVKEKTIDFMGCLNSIGIIDLHKYNIRQHNGSPIAIDYAINKGSHGQGEPTGGW